MIKIPGGIGQAGTDVLGLQIGVVRQNLVGGGSSGEHVEHILHANAHSANTRTPPALRGVDGDAFIGIHYVKTSRKLAENKEPEADGAPRRLNWEEGET